MEGRRSRFVASATGFYFYPQTSSRSFFLDSMQSIFKSVQVFREEQLFF